MSNDPNSRQEGPQDALGPFKKIITRIHVAQIDLLDVESRHLGEEVGKDGEDEGVRPEDEAVGADQPHVEQAAVEVRLPDAVGEEAKMKRGRYISEQLWSDMHKFLVILVGPTGEVDVRSRRRPRSWEELGGLGGR